MIDREKVIKGLKLCATGSECTGRDCPYWHNVLDDAIKGCDCTTELVRDALAMLKEQEARLMTLNEVKSFDWDYCYLEEERLPWEEYRIVCGNYALTCITWVYVASMRIQYGDNSYGKKWRCWSAKPTEEQRQAVKWDE